MDFRLADRTAKPIEPEQLLEFLNRPNILRLAIIDSRDGMPLVHPVWYYYENEKFYVSTDRKGTIARSLRKNPGAYFLVDMDPREGPPFGVRGKATASVVDDSEYATKVTVRNTLRYLGSLDGKISQRLVEMGKDSSVIEIEPIYMATWKF